MFLVSTWHYCCNLINSIISRWKDNAFCFYTDLSFRNSARLSMNIINSVDQTKLSCHASTKHRRFFRNVHPFNDSNKIKIEKNDSYASINMQDILAGAVLKEGKISERTVLVQSNLKKTFKCWVCQADTGFIVIRTSAHHSFLREM